MTVRFFLISDLHLNHHNIIEYSGRPFSSVREMNSRIINNWNSTVGRNDVVLFLGDFILTKSSVEDWISILHGKKVFIEGNHDVIKDRKGKIIRHKIKGALSAAFLTHRDYEFYLIHNPGKIRDNLSWTNSDIRKRWIIHGHTHNSSLQKYPFIDGRNQKINVSAEVINYKPLDIDNLLQLDLQTIERMNTIDSKVKRI